MVQFRLTGCYRGKGKREKMFFRHKYGGLYRLESLAKDSATGDDFVIYDHVFPFDEERWVRPKAEFFDGRFTMVTVAEVTKIMQQDPLLMAASIREAKASAKK